LVPTLAEDLLISKLGEDLLVSRLAEDLLISKLGEDLLVSRLAEDLLSSWERLFHVVNYVCVLCCVVDGVETRSGVF
jgi:hypothetical protein